MTPEEATRLLRNAPCELRHMQDPKGGPARKHAALASWGQHVRCMVAALERAGVLEDPGPALDNGPGTV